MGRSSIKFALVFVLLGVSGTSFSDSARETDVVRAVRKALPSAVTIRTISQVEETTLFGGVRKRMGMGFGSGFVVDSRGYILTCHHVTDKNLDLRVVLPGKKVVPGKVVSNRPEKDMALVKVDSPDSLVAVKFGKSSTLEVGETLIGFGGPEGMELSMTAGYFSARVDSLPVSETLSLRDMLQTSANLNPGNSGGPLFNLDGELVGLVEAIHPRGQGMGFAQASDSLRVTLAEMVREVVDSEAKIGIVAKLDSDQVIIDSVDDDADYRGLRRGDRVVRVNGRDVKDRADFELGFLGVSVGQSVPVEISRGMATEVVYLPVGKR